MAQGMHLAQKLALQQVLAPQLQQSLALLQAPTLELKSLIEQELQQNPVLEEVQTLETPSQSFSLNQEDNDIPPLDPTEPPSDIIYDPADDKDNNRPVDDFQSELEKLMQLDQEWREYFNEANAPIRSHEDTEEKRQYMFESLTTTPSLQDILLEQVKLSELDNDQKRIAELIIGNIDERGYLHASVHELAFSTNVPADQIETVLKVIQTFNPPGVAARDLRECLMLQLERIGKEDSLEYKIVKDHIEALGKKKYPEIAKAINVSIQEIQKAAERISALEPFPGRAFYPDDHLYVVPEVIVEKVGDSYTVTLNNEYLPHIRISNTYKDYLSKADCPQDVKDYIREKIRSGKFFIRSIYQRQETILKISQEIVKRQTEFLDKGIRFLKPMTMLQVAEAVGVHETTVSRAVSGKYMQTPQGVYEMKFFFSSGVKTINGSDMSNEGVKNLVAEIIKKENPKKPYSDEEIVKLLREQGINIARRTVAKYRTELNILPSNLRKIYT